MQNLSLHIEYLLRYHDCVILPGIGAFLRSRHAAVYGNDGVITPSYSEICFNASIKTDDGLLAHSVSRRDAIGFEQARVAVADTAEAMRSALLTDRELMLGRIGMMRMDSEGVISFEPFPSSSARLLKPLAPKGRKPESEKAAEAFGRAARSEYYLLRLPKKVVRYAAMIAVVCLCAMSLSIPQSPRDVQHDRASVVPLPEVSVSRGTPEPKPQTEMPQAAPARYYLIVGADKDMERCRQFMEKHPGAELKIIENGSNHLIYAGASADRQEMVTLMRDSDIKAEFGQGWIYDAGQ